MHRPVQSLAKAMERRPRMHHDLKLGTAAGTLLSALPHIGTDELLKTAILAAVGATVSFVVSLVLYRLRRPRRR